MPESKNPEETNTIINVSEETGNAAVLPLIQQAYLDDETILESVQAYADAQEKVTLNNAIMAIIASKILKLGIPEGRSVLLPASSLVLRNIYNTGLFGKETDLASLYEEVRSAVSLRERMEHGLSLGDRALHYRAGWRDNRHIGKVMSDEEINDYTSRMAIIGYNTAIKAAKRSSEERARIIENIVPQLRKYFEEIVKIIASFTDTEKDALEIQEAKKNLLLN